MVWIDDCGIMALGDRGFRIRQRTVKKPWLFVVLPGAGANDFFKDSVKISHRFLHPSKGSQRLIMQRQRLFYMMLERQFGLL